jgi:hypothetical protein
MRKFAFFVLVFLLASIAVSSTKAATITFTHSGASGSGTIAGIPFVDKAFTIIAIGDTGNVTSGPNFFSLVHTTASISITDVGTFDFVTATRTFVNTTTATIGFSRGGPIFFADLFDGPSNAIFAGYGLTTAIGPVFGSGNLLQWAGIDVLTTGGILVFNSTVGTIGAEFSAVGGVPVPAALPLFATGLGVLALLGWRRKRKATAN